MPLKKKKSSRSSLGTFTKRNAFRTRFSPEDMPGRMKSFWFDGLSSPLNKLRRLTTKNKYNCCNTMSHAMPPMALRRYASFDSCMPDPLPENSGHKASTMSSANDNQ